MVVVVELVVVVVVDVVVVGAALLLVVDVLEVVVVVLGGAVVVVVGAVELVEVLVLEVVVVGTALLVVVVLGAVEVVDVLVVEVVVGIVLLVVEDVELVVVVLGAVSRPASAILPVTTCPATNRPVSVAPPVTCSVPFNAQTRAPTSALRETAKRDPCVRIVEILGRAQARPWADSHIARHEDLSCRVGLEHRATACPQAAEDVAPAGQDEASVARGGAPDFHVAVHARCQRALVAGRDIDSGSSAAVGELVGNTTRRRKIGDERTDIGGPGPTARRGMSNRGGEEELSAPRPAADGDDVAGQRGVGTIDGVVRRERSLVHADVTVVDRGTRGRGCRGRRTARRWRDRDSGPQRRRSRAGK